MTKQDRLVLIRAICARPVKSVADKTLAGFRSEEEKTIAPSAEGFAASDAIAENRMEKEETRFEFDMGGYVSPEMARAEELPVVRRDVGVDYSAFDACLASL